MSRESCGHLSMAYVAVAPRLQPYIPLSCCFAGCQLSASLRLCPAIGIPEASDSMGYRGSLMFHGSSAEAIGQIVAVSA